MIWDKGKPKKKKRRCMKTKGVLYWKGKAWDEFSLYVRVRDAIRTTGRVENCVCCSCGKIYPAFGKGCLQAGHFIPGRKNAVLFSEIGVHGQCYMCNTRLKGNWPGYYDFMLRHYGQDVINNLLIEAKQVKKYRPFELEELRDEYKRKYLQMFENKELLYGESYEEILRTYNTVHSLF